MTRWTAGAGAPAAHAGGSVGRRRPAPPSAARLRLAVGGRSAAHWRALAPLGARLRAEAARMSGALLVAGAAGGAGAASVAGAPSGSGRPAALVAVALDQLRAEVPAAPGAHDALVVASAHGALAAGVAALLPELAAVPALSAVRLLALDAAAGAWAVAWSAVQRGGPPTTAADTAASWRAWANGAEDARRRAGLLDWIATGDAIDPGSAAVPVIRTTLDAARAALAALVRPLDGWPHAAAADRHSGARAEAAAIAASGFADPGSAWVALAAAQAGLAAVARLAATPGGRVWADGLDAAAAGEVPAREGLLAIAFLHDRPPPPLPAVAADASALDRAAGAGLLAYLRVALADRPRPTSGDNRAAGAAREGLRRMEGEIARAADGGAPMADVLTLLDRCARRTGDVGRWAERAGTTDPLLARWIVGWTVRLADATGHAATLPPGASWGLQAPAAPAWGLAQLGILPGLAEDADLRAAVSAAVSGA